METLPIMQDKVIKENDYARIKVSDKTKVLLVIKEGTFSALYDLFVQFNINNKKFYTLPKDGMNNHAKWEQKFDFEI